MMLTNRDSRFCISLWTERKFRCWDTRTKVSGSFVNFMEVETKMSLLDLMQTVIAFNLKDSKKHRDWSSIQTFSIPFGAPDYWTAFISCYNNLFTFDSSGCAFFNHLWSVPTNDDRWAARAMAYSSQLLLLLFWLEALPLIIAEA